MRQPLVMAVRDTKRQLLPILDALRHDRCSKILIRTCDTWTARQIPSASDRKRRIAAKPEPEIVVVEPSRRRRAEDSRSASRGGVETGAWRHVTTD